MNKTTNIINCVAKNPQNRELGPEIWKHIETFCPEPKTCIDCFKKFKNTWSCGGCKKHLCEEHYIRALRWGRYYRKHRIALCDNCCWFELG